MSDLDESQICARSDAPAGRMASCDDEMGGKLKTPVALPSHFGHYVGGHNSITGESMPPPKRAGNPRDTEVFGDRERNKIAGVVMGIVIANADPSNGGRVQISLPWLPFSSTMWAPTALPPGSANSAGYQIGDTVVVAFDHGDLSHPIVIGRLSA